MYILYGYLYVCVCVISIRFQNSRINNTKQRRNVLRKWTNVNLTLPTRLAPIASTRWIWPNTFFYRPHWESTRLTVNGFIAHRQPKSHSKWRTGCAPVWSHRRPDLHQRSNTGCLSALHAGLLWNDWRHILSCKEQDERLSETEARAAPNQQNEIPCRRVPATPGRE